MSEAQPIVPESGISMLFPKVEKVDDIFNLDVNVAAAPAPGLFPVYINISLSDNLNCAVPPAAIAVS